MTVTGTSSGYTNPTGTTIPCVTFQGATVNGNVLNAGTITPGSPSGIVVDNASTINGTITNSGQISIGGAPAIAIHGLVTGGLNNSGTLAGVQTIFIDGVIGNATTFLGGITNSGTISAIGLDAILFSVPTFTGGISNGGTISGVRDGIDYTFDQSPGIGVPAVSGGITNSGTISASGRDAIHLVGARTAVSPLLAAGTFTDGITNSGTLSGGNNGIYIAEFARFDGGIVNAAGGSITALGGDGIKLDATFDVTNHLSVTSFTGGITNDGTITAASDGIHVLGGFNTISGTILNTGHITANNGDGINIDNNAAVNVVSNAGTISAHNTGIYVLANSQLGGVFNSGNITATSGDGVHVESATAAGGVSNSGTISAAAGIGIFEGVHVAFAGGVTNSGTISAAAAGIQVRTPTFSGGISNSGTITATVVRGIEVLNSVLSFFGGITNTGTINAPVAGIDIVMTASNTFSGDIYNNGDINAAIAIAVSTPNAVTIDQVGGTITGTIQLSLHGDTLNISGGAIAGNIVGHNAGDIINFNLGAGTFTYGSAFHFSAVSQVNVNSGTVILDGSANAATNTTIAGGNLQVGDASNAGAQLTSTVDVTGGILSGHGTVVGPVTIESGGTLAPGGSIGTLTINGSATFNAGSTYAVTIDDSTASKTAVTGAPGTATINGGTVVVTPQFAGLGAHGGTTYTIVTATGGVGGTFAGLTVNGSFTGPMSLSYDPNDVFLNVGTGFTLLASPVGANVNQQNVLNGINSAILSGATVPAGFNTLAGLTGNAYLNALTQLSGEVGTGFQFSGFQAGNSFLELMLNPFTESRGGGFGPAIGYASAPARSPVLDSAFGAFAKAPPKGYVEPRYGLWAAGYGATGTVDGNAITGSNDLSSRFYGFAGGLDYRVTPDTMLGFALAGGGTRWSLDQNLGTGRSDMFQAGLYGTTHGGPAYLSGALSYSWHDVTTDRTVTVAGTDILQAKFNAQVFGARLEGGYRFAWGDFGFTPYALGQVQSMNLPSYAENATGGSNQFALAYSSQTVTTERTELGAWLDQTYAMGDGLLRFRERAAWVHDFNDSPTATSLFQTLPLSSFVVNGAKPDPDRALVTGAAEYKWASGWSFSAKFDGEFASNTATYAGTGVLRKEW